MNAFWFHYNKPESARRGRNVLTIHHKGKCEFVTDINCHVELTVRHRKQQPRCVMAGKGNVTFVEKADGSREAIIR